MDDFIQVASVASVVLVCPREHHPYLMQIRGQRQTRRVEVVLLQDHSVAHVEEPIVDPDIVQVGEQRQKDLLQETWLAEMAARDVSVSWTYAQ